MTQDQLISELSTRNLDWEVLNDNTDVLKITKQYKFKDFKEAMEFVNKVAEIAEKQQHHPDIAISYNKVQLVVWDHEAGGVSEKDFKLIEAMVTL